MLKRYDAIIIGAGIGGLICGNYLSKAGLKTLIVEQHTIPGGYCTSFARKGFKFDVGVHYLGGMKYGILGKILEELKVKEKLNIRQYDPVDKIIMPKNTTYVRARSKDTIEGFCEDFPKDQKNIRNFFIFITQKNFLNIYVKVKNMSFQNVLDDFFKDYRLKATLNILLGNIGAPASISSAVAAIVTFREYILDPGYYLSGGIQELPDVLVKALRDRGGDVVMGHKVTKINTDQNSVVSVRLDDNQEIKTNVVVSNADATSTFTELIDVKTKESEKVSHLVPTPSMALVYLGLNKRIRGLIKESSNLYCFSSYDINSAYTEYGHRIQKKSVDWVVCSFPSFHDDRTKIKKDTMMILTYAPYKSDLFWKRNKECIAKQMILKASKFIPGLQDCIDFELSASPATFVRYTLNREGAFAGWLPTDSQIKSKTMPQITSVKNLYLVGHWASVGYLPFGGIPNVAFTGRRAARFVLEQQNKKWDYVDSKSMF